MIESLPCLVCGVKLLRVTDAAEGQPDDGVMLTTHGNYGSTIFDPMDGNFLLFNLCDECLIAAGIEGHVLAGVDRALIETDTPVGERCVSTIVGHRRIDREMVKWNKDVPPDHVKEYIPIDEIPRYLDRPEYHFNFSLSTFESWKEELEHNGHL